MGDTVRRIFNSLFGPILLTVFKGRTELVKRGVPVWAKNATKYFVNKEINMLHKRFAQSEGSGITLSDNEIKDIKVI